MIRCLGILLWIVGLAFAETEFSPDSVITTFPDKISIQFLARYNYAAFSGASTDDEQMQTNCPIDLGLGAGMAILPGALCSRFHSAPIKANRVRRRRIYSSIISATAFLGISS